MQIALQPSDIGAPTYESLVLPSNDCQLESYEAKTLSQFKTAECFLNIKTDRF